MGLRTTILAVCAAVLGLLVLAFGVVAYRTGADETDAAIVRARATQLERTVDQAATNVRESRGLDLQMQAALVAELEQAKSRAAALDRALKKQESTPYVRSTTAPTPPLVGQSVLDVHTLCLLDAERAGATRPGTACAPGRTDAEVAAAAAAPTEVGGGDLARADLEIARRYRELATRHDGLVDWVDTHVLQLPTPSH